MTTSFKNCCNNNSTCTNTATPQEGLVGYAKQRGVSVPDHFICPITLDVMVHPLMTRTGTSFERKAICSWLAKGYGVCPLTRQPLTPSDLVPNKKLETEIFRWTFEHSFDEPNETFVDDDVDDTAIAIFQHTAVEQNDKRGWRISNPVRSVCRTY